jgi:hypothetical protein
VFASQGASGTCLRRKKPLSPGLQVIEGVAFVAWIGGIALVAGAIISLHRGVGVGNAMKAVYAKPGMPGP